MTHACLHHCHHLNVRSQRGQLAGCPIDVLLCRKYRESLPPDTERDAISQALATIFDVDKISDRIDRVVLTEATIQQDLTRVKALLQDALPEADWIRLDDIEFSHDWSGIKLALIFAAEHPHLQAAVGLVIGADDAKLTLGHIAYVNANRFCHTLQSSVNVAGRSYQRADQLPHLAAAS